MGRSADDISKSAIWRFVICKSEITNYYLANYFNSHRARGSADALDGGINRRSVQVGHVLLGDVFDLLERDLAALIFVRCAGSLGDTGCALQQNRSRGRLSNESK